MSIISTASAGLSAALDRTNRVAAAVASPSVSNDATPASPDAANASDPDIKNMLDLVTAKEAVEANAAVLRAGTRMSTHLVDILA